MLDELIAGLRGSRGLAAKRDIAAALAALGIADPSAAVPVGDDCAALPLTDDCGDGHLLFAIEGFLNEFVARDPWFAGWCGVMVNVSDIAAMGGRALAVVDALWSRDPQHMQPVLDGMAAAARAFGVPVVGGHSNARAAQEQLSVAIVGRAKKLLTSFDARPGDALLVAVDLRGAYREPFPHWNAATTAPPPRLRGDLELLPQLAEAGLCRAAKDISQAGVLGTALMLLECSGAGATLDVRRVPRPPQAPLARWLLHTFPSYGYLLAVPPAQVAEVIARFEARDLACAAVGRCDRSRQLRLREHGEERVAWDFAAQALTGCGPAAAPHMEERRHA
ncbi:sll0787 family AIR synthase-like protein [Solimonas soli]|uniref:sll0787 family AIR synthase-like protein n=1 Tax=Solimonas soli TaxID=413479 RepID=UPI0004BB83EA|nr:sll0787 family AIR synthase-like protein [Solimonas soli]